ncbi:MAG: transcription antitermination factor NusB, partial [Chloroflexi bacterium]|nr:transcription antitermination factor NusB [Chloroflexota bacterium]
RRREPVEMKPRRRARMAVLQTLYELDTSDHAPEQAFEQRMAEEPLPDGVVHFARELLMGVMQQRATLDHVIRQIAPEWPLDQIAIVDRNVLRMGVYEVLLSHATPVKVAINEAIELAKVFGGDTTPRFINGALGTLADRQNEFAQQLENQRRSTQQTSDE